MENKFTKIHFKTPNAAIQNFVQLSPQGVPGGSEYPRYNLALFTSTSTSLDSAEQC